MEIDMGAVFGIICFVIILLNIGYCIFDAEK